VSTVDYYPSPGHFPRVTMVREDGSVTRLVLWDIDGTLLDAAGFGWRVAERAFLEVCGSPLATTVPLAGRTDRSIYLEVLAANGRDEADLAALCAAIGVLAETTRDDLHAGGGRALPGAVAAIAALSAQAGVVQSVLTGNLRSLGLVKLGALGLLDRFDLAVAAFGDDHVVRADLVGVARERFGALDGSGPGPDIVLIGDTPLDVAAAHESGAAIVAVATGHFSAAELSAAGAPVVLPDLTDPDRVVAAVMAATPIPR
jgi:phosphoglycolate phosphatase